MNTHIMGEASYSLKKLLYIQFRLHRWNILNLNSIHYDFMSVRRLLETTGKRTL